MRNVEPVIARHARDMVAEIKKSSNEKDSKKVMKNDESCLNAAWDILREHGLLMMVLWLHDKEKPERVCLLKGAVRLLNEPSFGLRGGEDFPADDFQVLTDRLMKLTESLERTLLARRLLEHLFTYAKHF
jgi:hypothetical protein